MSLEITNIKTDKEKYIFGEDKEMEISFDIKSDNKEYNLNSIWVNYGIQIFLNGKYIMQKIEKLILSNYIKIFSGDIKSFTCTIPIIYTNTTKSGLDYDNVNLKNYIKIIADIKLNPFNCEKEHFLNIKINDKYFNNGEIDNYLKNDFEKEIESLITYSNKEKYDEIQNKINNLYDSENYLDDFDKIDIQIKELELELEKYHTISNKEQYDLLKEKVEDEDSLKFGFGEIKNKENKENYIPISSGTFGLEKDYINKEFYKYIKNNYFLFRLRELLRINFIKKIYFIILIGLILLSFFVNNVYLIHKIWSIFLWMLALIIPYFLIINNGINIVKNDILKIKINNKNLIKQKLFDKTLEFSDIFNELSIKYNGKYTCSFYASLDCILTVSREEGSGKSSRMVKYYNKIFSIKLCEYDGGDFNLRNIKIFDGLRNLEKIFIQPGILAKSGFIVSSSNAKITYEISYNFYSTDLINKNESITIN